MCEFFLFIAVLQFSPKFSTISPGLVILPLLIVLTITALKDAYEDVKRHQSDRRVNHSQVRVVAGGEGWANPNAMEKKSRTFVRGLVPKLRRSKKSKKVKNVNPDGEELAGVTSRRSTEPVIEHDDVPEEHHAHFPHILPSPSRSAAKPHWKHTAWEDVAVGDFVKIMDDESLPADVLICSTSEDENVAFVETKNLDGETNLKSRNAVPALTHIRSATDSVSPHNSFRIDCDRPDTNMYRLNAAVRVGNDTFPVDMQNVLLRGTVLRNTKWIIGVVIFTGADTRIVMNAGGTPSKRSKVERQMNPQVFINLLILALMAIACAVVDSILQHRYYPRDAPWLFWANRSGDNPSINGLITFFFALITFQNIVPISLYISIEFVRTCQAAFIYFDSEIYHKETDQPTIARSWNLSDDLGQIEYIFSDKTGTLTQNSMVFRKCCIGGRIYNGDPDMDDRDAEGREKDASSVKALPVLLDTKGSKPENAQDIQMAELSSASSSAGAKAIKAKVHFHDAELHHDIQQSLHAEAGAPDAAHARVLNGFFSVLALCHTVLTSVDPETGVIEYKAQSPDEAALVQAAADMGFVFRGRDSREVMLLQTPYSSGAASSSSRPATATSDPEKKGSTSTSPPPEGLERYELLNVLEFTSARKRMSVVVRKMDSDDQRLFLMTKGADNVIFERLKKGTGDDLKKETEKALDDFASQGLRTLTLAYKVISEEYYQAWAERYHEATVSLDDREEKIEAISSELEQDLRLLGATAIEDRLQDGVPETIADLKKAGIKIWVATGDKLETAIAIGHSTNLIGRDSNIIVIRGGNEGRPVYDQIMHSVEEFFPESGIIDERGEKALIVRLVKDGLETMTLAIGDGANDVSMIQAADVGVGISGEEGLQAVNSSDYAIAQFRFLKRLLLVHGHWSYYRNGNMILNFFYKNIVCIGVLWWFQIYCAWSSTYVLEYTYLLFWNSFWTIAPVIAIGLFDRLADDHDLMAFPELYRFGREGRWFGMKVFGVFMFDGVFQSAVIFFLILYTYVTVSSRSDGWAISIYELSTTMVFAAVFTANFYNGLNTNTWTAWVFFAVFLGDVLVWLYTAVYNSISPGWFVTPVYGNNNFLFKSAYFWLCLPLTIFISLLPRYLYKAYRMGYRADDIDIIRYVRKFNPGVELRQDSSEEMVYPRRPASVATRTPWIRFLDGGAWCRNSEIAE
ncbi:hypothetical protein H1R20_g7765, partial [Candolleomyces eurysporus]